VEKNGDRVQRNVNGKKKMSGLGEGGKIKTESKRRKYGLIDGKDERERKKRVLRICARER